MSCLRLLTVLIGLIGLVSGKDGDELKAVVVLFRHGDRAPLSSWPNDIYFGDSSLWPDGYGQLNNLGKERHFKLGQWFRERYDGFLPRRYNRSDIYVRSTDVDRTLMSAASNLAGLFPPEGDQVWNENVPWQAIPIHTMPQSQDPILTAEVPCPKHDRLQQNLLKSEEFQNIDLELADLYQNISNATGYSVEELNISSFSGFFSTITVYRGYNLTLPDWTEYYWHDIKTWAAKKFQLPTYTPELARLRTGPFFNYLLNYFTAIKEQTSMLAKPFNKRSRRDLKETIDVTIPKFLMLSAHDTTIGDRTNALGVYPDAVPEFASTVIWEVRSNGSGVYLNMYFKNSTGLSQLTVPGCQFDCSLDDLAAILGPLRTTDDEWTAECNEG